jgi:hypothetical protein
MVRIMRTYITEIVPLGAANAVPIGAGDADFDPDSLNPLYKVSVLENEAELPLELGHWREAHEKPRVSDMVDIPHSPKIIVANKPVIGNSPVVNAGDTAMPLSQSAHWLNHGRRLTHAQRRRLITLLLPGPVSGRGYRARVSSPRFMPRSPFNASARQPMPIKAALGQQNARSLVRPSLAQNASLTPLPPQPSAARGRHRLKSGMTVLAEPSPQADAAPLLVPISLRHGMINVPTRPSSSAMRSIANKSGGRAAAASAGAPSPR